jgi:hypothetical protein
MENRNKSWSRRRREKRTLACLPEEGESLVRKKISSHGSSQIQPPKKNTKISFNHREFSPVQLKLENALVLAAGCKKFVSKCKKGCARRSCPQRRAAERNTAATGSSALQLLATGWAPRVANVSAGLRSTVVLAAEQASTATPGMSGLRGTVTGWWRGLLFGVRMGETVFVRTVFM